MAELRVQHVMGTAVRIEVRDRRVAAGALDAAFAALREADRRFSTYRPDSEVCRIDRGELRLGDAHADVREVVARCERLRRATGGAFDARATGRLDPSGLVKGWAVGRAAAALEAGGAECFSIVAGGDVLARGGPWRVGIQHPDRRDRLAGALEVHDAAVATSGSYERGDHVLDPLTGRPATAAVSVTVVGPEPALADAYATAAVAMGARGPEWTATLGGYDAMTILRGGRVLTTPGFDRCRRGFAVPGRYGDS